MRSKLSFNDFSSALFVLVFLLGFQTLSQAQLTIHNATSCRIYVQAAQVDNGSGQPCTPCNISSITAIAPGGTWVHPGDATCGHYRWLGVRWYTSASSAFGVSFNPVWSGACGMNARGGSCGSSGTFTYARWNVPSSPGPASVKISEF